MSKFTWAPLLTLLLIACGTATPPDANSSNPASLAEATGKQEIDYSCETAADCEIKDVGNCCGYYPACVNRQSATFPEQVKAECEKEGRMGVCGFPEISGCDCVEGRCINREGPAAAPADEK